MPPDRDMPDSWRQNKQERANEVTAAILRARAAREDGDGEPAEEPVDELAQRRARRRAAEEARRKLRPTDPPPGPRTA